MSVPVMAVQSVVVMSTHVTSAKSMASSSIVSSAITSPSIPSPLFHTVAPRVIVSPVETVKPPSMITVQSSVVKVWSVMSAEP